MVTFTDRRTRGALAAVVGAALCMTAACTKQGSNSSGASSASSASTSSVTVAFVPKLQAAYYDAMDTGAEAAAKALGFKWVVNAPSTADPAAQAGIVQSLIQQKVDVIAVAPDDPDSLAPVLAQAKAAGIKVITSDSDAPNSVRSVFVNQGTAQAIGEALVDQMVKAMGDTGEYAIVSCGQTAANLNAWIAVQKSYAAKKYPGLKLDSVVYASEDQAQAVTMAKSLMAAHPHIKGLVGECTTSAPGVAQAVQETGKIGKVFTVGVGTPKSMQPFLNDGSSSASVLWDVQALGYLTAWTGYELATGKTLQPVNHVSDSLPAVKEGVMEGVPTVLLGPPLILTKANVGQYDY
ncbi:autoinducer 2 ABC transporter substrate-binding protein [Streptomyces sp. NPDC087263]|uniref:autoinducer 2 ABC transporter substrate-binding protein n=1 Tax=Streptomyces sp. NPDC087263 TaxID=3365773 RepID=UPI003822714F